MKPIDAVPFPINFRRLIPLAAGLEYPPLEIFEIFVNTRDPQFDCYPIVDRD
jgi:hypothetical protein